MSRAWLADAIGAIEADFARSSDTHLLRFDLPELPQIRLYLKDESTHPSGSLKHRLARSLFLYGLCNGWIVEGRPVVEASSGSTAISEAYFARLLNLEFIAVLPESTASRKIAEITRQGGRVHKVACATEIDRTARELAAQLSGHFLDQFTYAERATDWRGNNNIAESLFTQMGREPHPIPEWIVVGAGTGGTSATLGRYVRYTPRLARQAKICVVDPVGSAFFPAYARIRHDVAAFEGSVAEGVGRPRVEPSFLPDVIDRMIAVPDAASVAATLWLERRIGRRCGPSTGINLIGAMVLAQEMTDAGRAGAITTLICDSGDRYVDTIFDADWRSARKLDDAGWRRCFDDFERTSRFAPACVLADTGYRGG